MINNQWFIKSGCFGKNIFYRVIFYITKFIQKRRQTTIVCLKNIFYFSDKGILSFEKVRLTKTIHRITEAISAIGIDHHTRSRFPNFDSINATGKRIINCREIDVTSEYIPWPRAWRIDKVTIQNPAAIKLILIILRAGTPIAVS